MDGSSYVPPSLIEYICASSADSFSSRYAETALPNSIYSAATSVASVSSVSSISVLSSLSTAIGPASLSALSVSSQSWASVIAKATSDPGGSLQGGGVSKGNSFPAWAIALLVVLGVLALISVSGLLFLLIQRYRRRNRRSSGLTHRESMGSSSPMMAQIGEPPNSPPGGASSPPPNYGARGGAFGERAAAFGAGLGIGGKGAGAGGLRHNNSIAHDGASARSVSDGPISGQDAAIMADAFRLALRKPDFADRPMEEGESPDTNPNTTGSARKSSDRPDMLGNALAEEGNNLRNVGSARGVRVEYPSDDSDGSPVAKKHE